MKNVLLIDDDILFQYLGKRMLEGLGILEERIDTATDGEQALNLFNDYYSGTRALPEVILLDLNMPIMDGFGFLEAFRRLDLPKKADVRIVIVTSSDNPADVARARELGITHYLTKPVDKSALKLALS